MAVFHAGLLAAGQPFKIAVEDHPDSAVDPTPITQLIHLHSAYLMLFYVFGYEYVRHARVQWVRDMLRSRTLPSELQLLQHDTDKAEGKQYLFKAGVVLVNGRHRAVCAFVPSPYKNATARLLLLPGPGVSGEKEYEAIKEIDLRVPIDMRFSLPTDEPLQRLQMWESQSDLRLRWRAIAPSPSSFAVIYKGQGC